MKKQEIEDKDIKDFYNDHAVKYSAQLKTVKHQINLISNIRLAVALIAIAVSVYAYRIDPYFFFSIVVSGIVGFFLLVFYHETLHQRKCSIENVLNVLHRNLSRLSGNWTGYSDTGDDFINDEHPFSTDLDMFGKGSLFQWISSSHTFYGRKQLASDILLTPSTIGQVVQQQGAITDCAKHFNFRLSFEAAALDIKVKSDQEPLLKWAESGVSRWASMAPWFFYAEPVVAALSAMICSVFFKIPLIAYIIYTVHLLLFGLFFFSNKKFMDRFEACGATVLVYSRLLSLIEKEDFSDKVLLRYKNGLVSENGTVVSKELKKLSQLISSMEIRYNPLGHFIANVGLLWDLRLRINAENWKKNNSKNLRKWFEIIGWFESVNSFSGIAFENQDWHYPQITDEASLSCTDMGHPLIPDNRRIHNSFTINDNQVAIITGSNMSGKSTFLRTVGVNMVLAYAGAPVCGKSMCVPLLKIFSSMRIGDDLSGNVSTFYAELLKIKRIIDEDKNGTPILFLLDELFRGTNSSDRHEGAVAVLSKLKKHGNIGLISTHDLQLCELAQGDKNGYENYHFTETYNENGIAFDYTLRQGPSTTRNALYLIKMLGIV